MQSIDSGLGMDIQSPQQITRGELKIIVFRLLRNKSSSSSMNVGHSCTHRAHLLILVLIPTLACPLVDDDSGASITCCVNPSKVYANELSASRDRQASFHPCSSRNGDADSTASSGYDSTQEHDNEQATPRVLRTRQAGPLVEENDSTPRSRVEPKSDPRLWIYRYKSPPHPLPPRSKSSSTTLPFNVPVYKEGTVVRIIGKIFTNATRGNERQLEASSIECLYEPGYILGKRIYQEKGNKYAEWHHTVKSKKKRLEYGDRQRVREIIGFGPSNDVNSTSSIVQAMSEDVTMQDDTMVSHFLH